MYGRNPVPHWIGGGVTQNLEFFLQIWREAKTSWFEEKNIQGNGENVYDIHNIKKPLLQNRTEVMNPYEECCIGSVWTNRQKNWFARHHSSHFFSHDSGSPLVQPHPNKLETTEANQNWASGTVVVDEIEFNRK